VGRRGGNSFHNRKNSIDREGGEELGAGTDHLRKGMGESEEKINIGKEYMGNLGAEGSDTILNEDVALSQVDFSGDGAENLMSNKKKEMCNGRGTRRKNRTFSTCPTAIPYDREITFG
jgi:hypothetical protein